MYQFVCTQTQLTPLQTFLEEIFLSMQRKEENVATMKTKYCRNFEFKKSLDLVIYALRDSVTSTPLSISQ